MSTLEFNNVEYNIVLVMEVMNQGFQINMIYFFRSIGKMNSAIFMIYVVFLVSPRIHIPNEIHVKLVSIVPFEFIFFLSN